MQQNLVSCGPYTPNNCTKQTEQLRGFAAGHSNVFYVGDRVKKAGQLNGKSANLNYVLLNKIYPTARTAQDVPVKDIFMVMDCDHMVGFLNLSPPKMLPNS